MKSGFTSIELIMVIAVSTIMMTALFQMYNQVTSSMVRIDRCIFEDVRILTLRNRFEKDISGMSAIWFEKNELKDVQASMKQVETPAEQKVKSRYFYSTNKNGNLDTLTFLTTNALRLYQSKQNYFVRVVYQLQADLKHEGLFRLMRKEIVTASENIDSEALQQGTFYEVVNGVKSITVSYQLIDAVELERQYNEYKKSKTDALSKESQQSEKKQKSVVRVVKEWNLTDLAKQEKEENQEDLSGAAVPKIIHMKIVFGQTDEIIERTYNLICIVPCVVDNIPKTVIKKNIVAQTGAVSTS